MVNHKWWKEKRKCGSEPMKYSNRSEIKSESELSDYVWAKSQRRWWCWRWWHGERVHQKEVTQNTTASWCGCFRYCWCCRCRRCCWRRGRCRPPAEGLLHWPCLCVKMRSRKVISEKCEISIQMTRNTTSTTFLPHSSPWRGAGSEGAQEPAASVATTSASHCRVEIWHQVSVCQSNSDKCGWLLSAYTYF